MGHARRKDDPRQLGLRYPEKKLPAAPREAPPVAAPSAPEGVLPPEPTDEDSLTEDRAEKAHDAGGFRREGPPRNWRRRS